MTIKTNQDNGDKIRDKKNCNAILTEKQHKHQFQNQVKDKYDYVRGKEVLPSNQSELIKQAKLKYSKHWKNTQRNNLMR